MKPVWLAVAAAIALGIPVRAQEPAAPAGRPQSSGIQVADIAVYGSSYSITYPSSPDVTRLPSAWLQTVGGEAELAWRWSAPSGEVFVRYRGGYSRNRRFPDLNGADHSATVSVRKDLAPHLAFDVEAMGDSRIMMGGLFETPGLLASAQQVDSALQLQTGLTSRAEVGTTPLDVVLSGARRTSGLLGAGITYSPSRRFAWTGNVSINRVLRASSADAALAEEYPSVTLGSARTGFTYSTSRRSQIGGEVEYSRTYSSLYRFDWESASLRLERQLGHSSFGRLEGGAERMTPIEGSGVARSSYNAGAGLGTVKGYHTLMVTAHHGIANPYGLPSDRSDTLSAAWNWAPVAVRWAIGASANYDRIETKAFGVIETSGYLVTLTRRLTNRMHLLLEGAYINNARRDFARNGVKVSWLWIVSEPAATHN